MEEHFVIYCCMVHASLLHSVVSTDTWRWYLYLACILCISKSAWSISVVADNSNQSMCSLVKRKNIKFVKWSLQEAAFYTLVINLVIFFCDGEHTCIVEFMQKWIGNMWNQQSLLYLLLWVLWRPSWWAYWTMSEDKMCCRLSTY